MTTIKEMIARLTPQQLSALRAHRELFEELDQTVMDALKAASACLIYLWGTRIYTQDELLTLLKEVSDDLLMTAQALTGLAEPK